MFDALSPDEWDAIVLSLQVGLVSVPVSLPFGLFFAWLLARRAFPRKSLLDWVILHVPGVTVIYASVRKVFATLQIQHEGQKFQRVVLVPFPHPGMKVPAFVTSSCLDVATGKTILCVYVPTTPVPTSGYMLLLPEEDATEVSWSLDDTLQAIMSGGISVPEKVEYFPLSRYALVLVRSANITCLVVVRSANITSCPLAFMSRQLLSV